MNVIRDITENLSDIRSNSALPLEQMSSGGTKIPSAHLNKAATVISNGNSRYAQIFQTYGPLACAVAIGIYHFYSKKRWDKDKSGAIEKHRRLEETHQKLQEECDSLKKKCKNMNFILDDDSLENDPSHPISESDDLLSETTMTTVDPALKADDQIRQILHIENEDLKQKNLTLKYKIGQCRDILELLNQNKRN